MSLFRNLFASAMFGVMLTTGIFATAPAVQAKTISEQYDSIRSEGLIFANLCDGTFHTGDTTAAGGTCACRDQGKCSLEQVLQMFVNVSYLVLALSGSAALIAFVYGGFEWILSAGYSERVDRGKKAIVGAAVGLVIVFGAYVFINLVISILKFGEPAASTIERTIGDGAETIIKSE
ncbi:MAG: hypothetical protein AAB663_02770 [Patescibacteria group bacterium]